jgi:hypothetical protein
MESTTEGIQVVQHTSGSAIIEDLLNRIREKLQGSGDLRSVDAYTAYSVKVEIELQLMDIDTANINTEVAVGTINPALPSQHITLGEAVVAEKADDTLERAVDGEPVKAAHNAQGRFVGK